MSRYYVNRSIGEIAEKLDVSVSTVKKELASIKADLKKKLLQLNYRLPVLTDFKPNPDLADEVIETMESLNMCFSMETQTANVLN